MRRKPPVHKPHCTHTEGPWHDCDYVDQINKLVEIAAMDADKSVVQAQFDGAIAPVDFNGQRRHFVKKFLENMEAETEARGLRKPLPKGAK